MLLVTVCHSELVSEPQDSYEELLEIADIDSINPIIPQSWGTFKAGGHPQTPARGKSLWTPFTTVIARSDSDEAILGVVV